MSKLSTSIGDLKPSDLVAKIGLSRSYASELLKGHKTPSLDIAIRIEREFGVPAAAWVEKPASEGGIAA